MPRQPFIRTAGTYTLLVSTCLAGCLALGPSWDDVRDLATAPQQLTHEAGADHTAVVIVGLLLWILCGWLTIAVACCMGGALPGRGGRVCSRIGRHISPRLARRVLGAAVGISLGPAVAPSAVASPPTYTVVAVTDLTQDDAVLIEEAGVDWPVQPAIPVSPTESPPAPPDGTTTIAVRPGDCLWSLVEAHLGYGATLAEISDEVDRWWDRNADIIGTDPDLLIPDQVLVIPTT